MPTATLLDLPEIHPRLVRWTVEEYEHLAEQGVLPKRAELLRGLIVEKMPKSPLHRSLSKRLYDLMQKALPPEFLVFQEAPLRLLDSEPEPDVSVVQGDEEQFKTRHPTTASLVVEVAVSSVALDRANADLYAEAGIPEYWIILGLERQAEVYRLNSAGTYGEPYVASLEDTLECVALPGVTIRMSDLFA